MRPFGRWTPGRHGGATLVAELERLKCPRCGDIGAWDAQSRLTVRQNSRMQRAQCRSCRHQVVVKQCLVSHSLNVDVAQAAEEFEAQVRVHSTFSRSDEYTTLTPVEHMADAGIVVTDFFPGESGSVRMKHSDITRREQTVRACANWLRLFHQSFEAGSCELQAADKLESLRRSWESVPHPAVRASRSLEVLRDELGVARTRLPETSLHGDFKPENVLLNEETTVGIDCALRHRAAGVYDVAPFLNHLALSWRFALGCHRAELESLEAAFLEAYFVGDSEPEAVVLWLRLYFALSYWQTSLRHRPLYKPLYDGLFARLSSRLAQTLVESARRAESAAIASEQHELRL